jgi:hypothetical protein
LEAKTGASVLSTEEITSFAEQGHVRVAEAFPRDAALAMQEFMWEELQALHGIDRRDRATWTRVLAGSGMNRSSAAPIFDGIASPRLCGAIDQLLGPGAWSVPRGWGAFLISFPPGSPSPWALPSRGWHWDGDAFRNLDGLNDLFVFTFYSEVRPQGGGTLAVSGSHRLLARFLRALPPDDPRKHANLRKRFGSSCPWLAELTRGAADAAGRIARFMQTATEVDGIPVRVIELTGAPGDAILCHPSIVHAVSPNRADVPRFMRAKTLETRAP